MQLELKESEPTIEGYYIVFDKDGDPMIVYYDHECDVIDSRGYIFKTSDFSSWSTVLMF